MVMRDTLRETGDEEKEEDEDEEEEEEEEEEEQEEREVNEHLFIVNEIGGEDVEEDDDDARMNVEYGGGISLTNTTSTSSILFSPPLTLTTPLFSLRVISSVSLLIFTFTLCSFSFSPDVTVPLLLISVEMSVISTSPVISITPVGSMMTFSGSDRCDEEE